MRAEQRPLVQAYLSSKQLFYRLVDVWVNAKIAPPTTYVVLRTLIGKAVHAHKAELIHNPVVSAAPET